MTNVTTILSNESGIQYQGVHDASSSTGTYPVIGLIVGTFLGGRTDKPMTITNANIKAILGFDPSNPHYTAVQDVLNSGVPSVQVLRVADGGAPELEPPSEVYPIPEGVDLSIPPTLPPYDGSYKLFSGIRDPDFDLFTLTFNWDTPMPPDDSTMNQAIGSLNFTGMDNYNFREMVKITRMENDPIRVLVDFSKVPKALMAQMYVTSGRQFDMSQTLE